MAIWMSPGFAADQPAAELNRDVQSGELPAASSVSTDGAEAGTLPSAGPELIARLESAPQSPVLRRLWSRLLTANPNDGVSLGPIVELLLRGGAVDRVLGIADKLPVKSEKSPGLIVAIAEASLARGRDDAACSMIARLVGGGQVGGKVELAAALEVRALRMTAFCEALPGDKESAKLAAAMLAEKKAGTPPIFAALEALESGNEQKQWKPVEPGKPGGIGVVDVRFLALAGPDIDQAALDSATPAALSAILATAGLNSDTRVAAAEAAARLGVIDPAALARAYSKAEVDPSDLANPLASSDDGPAKRSLLSQAVSRTTDPAKRAQLIRALVDDARSDGLEAEVA